MNSKLIRGLSILLTGVGVIFAWLLIRNVATLAYHLRGLIKIISGGYSGKLGYYLGGLSFYLTLAIASYFCIRIGLKLHSKYK